MTVNKMNVMLIGVILFMCAVVVFTAWRVDQIWNNTTHQLCAMYRGAGYDLHSCKGW